MISILRTSERKPCAKIFPDFKHRTCLISGTSSSKRWLTSQIANPLCISPEMLCDNHFADAVSRPSKGSSRINSLGPASRALAIRVLRVSPFEKCRNGFSKSGTSPRCSAVSSSFSVWSPSGSMNSCPLKECCSLPLYSS